MKLKNFKVGDRVRCINNGGYSTFTVGGVYTIDFTFSNFGYAPQELIGFREVGDHNANWFADKFELFTEKANTEKEIVDKKDVRDYYALFNQTTMEIKAISITEDQFLHKSMRCGDTSGFTEVKICLEI